MPDSQRRVLVLTASQGAEALLRAFVDALDVEMLADAAATASRQLGPTAWEAEFSPRGELTDARLIASLEATIGDAPIDVNIVPAGANRVKRLLVADMESTIIQEEMLDEIAGEIGAREHISEITARAMRGELDFEAALDERVGLLAGIDTTVLDRLAASGMSLMPGAPELVATMKATGATCALVSGGFTVFAAPVAERLGFDVFRANSLDVEGGKLTGRVRRPILGRSAKRDALNECLSERNLDAAASIAVGDGSNDLAMLEAAGLGVAFRAKPVVRAAARALPNGAVITHGDLTALLYLQGIPSTEFARR